MADHDKLVTWRLENGYPRIRMSDLAVSMGEINELETWQLIPRAATQVVAASDASAAFKAAADQVGDGTADDVQIHAARDALPD